MTSYGNFPPYVTPYETGMNPSKQTLESEVLGAAACSAAERAERCQAMQRNLNSILAPYSAEAFSYLSPKPQSIVTKILNISATDADRFVERDGRVDKSTSFTMKLHRRRSEQPLEEVVFRLKEHILVQMTFAEDGAPTAFAFNYIGSAPQGGVNLDALRALRTKRLDEPAGCIAVQSVFERPPLRNMTTLQVNYLRDSVGPMVSFYNLNASHAYEGPSRKSIICEYDPITDAFRAHYAGLTVPATTMLAAIDELATTIPLAPPTEVLPHDLR